MRWPRQFIGFDHDVDGHRHRYQRRHIRSPGHHDVVRFGSRANR
jgi:hypothetical protein